MPSSSHRAYARFIPSEEVGSVTQWRFGAVDGSGLTEPVVDAIPVEEVAVEVDEAAQQALLQQACDDAYAQGFAQGQAQAALEWQRRMDEYIAHQGQEAAQRLQGVMQSLDHRLGEMQQDIAQEVLALACDIARQVVRQEISVNSHVLQPVVREALGMLVTEGRPAVIKLNPVDMDAVGGALAEDAGAPGVRWVADVTVSQGGCIVESAGTVVDATVGKRWERAVASLGLESVWQEDEPDAD